MGGLSLGRSFIKVVFFFGCKGGAAMYLDGHSQTKEVDVDVKQHERSGRGR